LRAEADTPVCGSRRTVHGAFIRSEWSLDDEEGISYSRTKCSATASVKSGLRNSVVVV
jgi:hypothetical protein